MKRKEITARANAMLNEGVAKQQVFETLTGEGGKPKTVAYVIASHLDPRLREASGGHRIAVIALAYIQLVVALLIVFALGLTLPAAFTIIMVLIVGSIGGAFVWGFTKDKASCYNVYIYLGIVQCGRGLLGIAADPVAVIAGLAISFALIAYLLFVRKRLFPDFDFLGPKRIKGEYVFVEPAG
ncbi:hypothetical protein [Robbsia sp. KACC 23696]|uniref:hypothetical protein n=1 Tax=Robbsia sp. KACC 23696 TaxID=3149231 RepID=UPI00325A764D